MITYCDQSFPKYIVSHKIDTDLHNITMTYSTVHEGILIIFSKYVTKKISNEKLLYFPPYLTGVSTLPGETGNQKLCLFT